MCYTTPAIMFLTKEALNSTINNSNNCYGLFIVVVVVVLIYLGHNHSSVEVFTSFARHRDGY